jgi:hypothetical protein
MEEFHQARANKNCLHIHIKEMHTHMRKTELKKEEEFKQREGALKNGRKN